MFNLDLSFILTFNIKKGFQCIYGLVIETLPTYLMWFIKMGSIYSSFSELSIEIYFKLDGLIYINIFKLAFLPGSFLFKFLEVTF